MPETTGRRRAVSSRKKRSNPGGRSLRAPVCSRRLPGAKKSARNAGSIP